MARQQRATPARDYLLPSKPVHEAVQQRRNSSAAVTMNTRPAYRANSPANSLPPGVTGCPPAPFRQQHRRVQEGIERLQALEIAVSRHSRFRSRRRSGPRKMRNAARGGARNAPGSTAVRVFFVHGALHGTAFRKSLKSPVMACKAASAASPAVSVRMMRGPRRQAANPLASANWRSLSASPPSGPISNASGRPAARDANAGERQAPSAPSSARETSAGTCATASPRARARRWPARDCVRIARKPRSRSPAGARRALGRQGRRAPAHSQTRALAGDCDCGLRAMRTQSRAAIVEPLALGEALPDRARLRTRTAGGQRLPVARRFAASARSTARAVDRSGRRSRRQ